jgi:hypothetical protein
MQTIPSRKDNMEFLEQELLLTPSLAQLSQCLCTEAGTISQGP